MNHPKGVSPSIMALSGSTNQGEVESPSIVKPSVARQSQGGYLQNFQNNQTGTGTIHSTSTSSSGPVYQPLPKINQ